MNVFDEMEEKKELRKDHHQHQHSQKYSTHSMMKKNVSMMMDEKM
jgi:hypothetical protein